MLKGLVLAVLYLSVAALVAAQETEKTPAGALSAGEVLLKCAEAYSSVTILYEKGDLYVTINAAAEPAYKGRWALAARRVGQCAYSEKAGDGGSFEMSGDNSEGLLMGIVDIWRHIQFEKDPVTYAREKLKTEGDAETVDLDGKQVLKITVRTVEGKSENSEVWYLDPETFHFVGMDIRHPYMTLLPGSPEEKRYYHTFRVCEAHVNEVRKDASGNQIGVRPYVGIRNQQRGRRRAR